MEHRATIEQTPTWSSDTTPHGTGEALVALRDRPTDWFESCVTRLQEVAELGENWDSYGAEPVKIVAVHYAHRFLARLVHTQGIERPAITATPNGYVAFAWDDNVRSMDLEIDDRGQLAYCYERTISPNQQDAAPRVTTNFDEIIDLLTRV